MTKVDVFSGFLGAGKTTLIRKLLAEAYQGERLMLIENEFGEISVDGGFLKDTGVEIRELSSGCICCSLTGDFRAALAEAITRYAPDRILIEPSGVGKLSDVAEAVRGVDGCEVSSLVTVADATRCKMYMKNFGEFFNNQIEHAGCIVLSRTEKLSPKALEATLALLREKNPHAVYVTTPWEALSGEALRTAIERRDTLQAALEALGREAGVCPECGCRHEHEHHHEHECECGHDHEAEHHHEHEHEHTCECGHDHEQEHHHDHDCDCGQEHHHHHGHDADEIFVSWGMETAKTFAEDALRARLEALGDEEKYGLVLRCKGIVDGGDGGFFHFDYVPGEPSLRRGDAAVTGRLCVIGSRLNEAALTALFEG